MASTLDAHSPWYCATAPSNIALLKYWGKQPGAEQWPTNTSLSLSLSELKTTTFARSHQGPAHQVKLGGSMMSSDDLAAAKIFTHLDRITAAAQVSHKLTITTSNSFPSACGIASSASGFAALTIAGLAACYNAESLSELAEYSWTRQRLADLARRGSGSACRSLWGGVVRWLPGAAADQQRYEQLYNEGYWPLADTVLLVSAERKAHSSSAGHALAWSSPLYGPRLAGIEEKRQSLEQALATRSITELGPIIEQEALEMHAVMMSAEPATPYFGAPTSELLVWLRQQRQREGLPLYFTLDAGPNVHIIGEPAAHELLHRRLARDFPGVQYVYDTIGGGPQLMRSSPSEEEFR